MWRLLPDRWLWFCPYSSMARVMTCSYVVPVHQQGHWWTIVFSLYEGALLVLHYVTWLVVQIYGCCTLIFVPCLCNVILTVFFLDVILYSIEVYFDIIVFLTSLFVSDFFSIFFHQSHPFATCFYGELYSDIKYFSSLARVVIDTYVVPRHWHGQWWPVVLSSERASVTNCITIWKCRCSSEFNSLH